MSYIPTDFRTALEMDMERAQMLEKELGARLGVSQQSISKWKARNFPPLYRVKQLIEVLGHDSYVAKLDLPNMLANTPRLRIAVPSKENGPPVLPRGQYPTHVPAQPAVAQEDLADYLPAPLRGYVGAQGPALGDRHVRADYHSEHLALLVKRIDVLGSNMLMAPAILTLAAARAASNLPTKTFALAIILNGSTTAQTEARVLPVSLRESAKALGVEIWIVAGVRGLQARISEVEGVPPSAQAPGAEFEEEDEFLT